MPINIHANVPIAVTAIQTIDFGSVGLDDSKILVIHRIGNPPASWMPNKSINAINGFVSGQGYVIYAKVDLDLSNFVVPPIESDYEEVKNWVIANYSQLGHVHTIAQVTGLQTTLNDKLTIPANPIEGKVLKYTSGSIQWANDSGGSSVSLEWANITGKPITFTPSSHSHGISEVTGLQNALNGKQAAINTGTVNQYLKGDLSLGTFPTVLSSFINDSGYITNSSLTWSNIVSKPSTLSGYGITDAQVMLVSGSNIKTINGVSLLGSGNINITGSGSGSSAWTDITGKPTTLFGYGITDAFTKTQADTYYSALGHVHSFATLTAKPTTLSGYGITDAFNGDYTNLNNKPTIPTNTNELTNGAGFITSSSLTWNNLTGKPSTFTPSAHNHSATEVTSGVFDVTRLGTGTADNTKVLYGDGSWKAAPSGGSDMAATFTSDEFSI